MSNQGGTAGNPESPITPLGLFNRVMFHSKQESEYLGIFSSNSTSLRRAIGQFTLREAIAKPFLKPRSC